MEFYLLKILNFFINPLYILSLVILIQLFIIFFLQSKKLVIFFSKLFLILFLIFINQIYKIMTTYGYPI